MIEGKVKEEITLAMKKKDSKRLIALRNILSSLVNLKSSTHSLSREITENDFLVELQRLIKQMKESAKIYKKNNRETLYEKEMFEISVVEEFLPEQMSEDDIEKEIKLVIEELKATTIKDMGKVINLVRNKLIGKADGKIISEISKKLLNS